MGILKQKEAAAVADAAKGTASKRASVQAGIANLKPLKPGGARGFTGIRDGAVGADDDMDDEDDSPAIKVKDDDGNEDIKNSLLSPEDAKKQGEIADGVERIRVSHQAQ